MTVCPRCAARWSALGVARCSACHRVFSTAAAFDRHRTARGDRGGCIEPATIRAARGEPVMVDRDGMWRAPEMPAAVRQARGSLDARGSAA